MVERAIVGYAALFGRSFSLILAFRWLFYFWQFVSTAACILGPKVLLWKVAESSSPPHSNSVILDRDTSRLNTK
jgi:hypothetical protein